MGKYEMPKKMGFDMTTASYYVFGTASYSAMKNKAIN